MPRSFLGISKSYGDISVPVTRVELDNAVNPGVQMKAMGAEMVPIYEEHTARLEAGYKLDDWTTLDMMEKALVIAQRRSKIAFENIQSDAQIKHAKRNAGRK